MRRTRSTGRPSDAPPGKPLTDSRVAHVDVPPSAAFAPIRRIAGASGWFYANWLWQLRGLIDVLVGGVGMRRGRRDPESLQVGDVVDCWRVEAFESDRYLLLRAEMKLPGRGWLEFEVRRNGARSTIRQTAIFDARGWAGLAYWCAAYPLHHLVFAGMLRNIAATCSRAPVHIQPD